MNNLRDAIRTPTRPRAGPTPALIGLLVLGACLLAGAGPQGPHVHLQGRISGVSPLTVIDDRFGEFLVLDTPERAVYRVTDTTDLAAGDRVEVLGGTRGGTLTAVRIGAGTGPMPGLREGMGRWQRMAARGLKGRIAALHPMTVALDGGKEARPVIPPGILVLRQASLCAADAGREAALSGVLITAGTVRAGALFVGPGAYKALPVGPHAPPPVSRENR